MMKFLTPELLARYRSLDDDVADAAALEWDRATAIYGARAATIRNELPKGAQSILKHLSLHDAKLLGVALAKRAPWLILLIELEGSLEQYQFKYTVAPKSHPLKIASGKISHDERRPQPNSLRRIR